MYFNFFVCQINYSDFDLRLLAVVNFDTTLHFLIPLVQHFDRMGSLHGHSKKSPPEVCDPEKRREVADMVTIDQVSTLAILIIIIYRFASI